MADGGPRPDLDAGAFAAWARGMRAALNGAAGADVPCNGCTACCRSRQFVPVAPDEADAVAHIPAALLFPAPRRPRGHVVLGFDERGHCPLLVEDRCTVYAHRPRACRTYDCRILAAAGVDVAADGKPAIAERVRRWRFDLPAAEDRARLAAVRAVADVLTRHPGLLPPDVAPVDGTQVALLAFEVHDDFLTRDLRTGDPVARRPEPAEVRAAVLRRAAGSGRVAGSGRAAGRS